MKKFFFCKNEKNPLTKVEHDNTDQVKNLMANNTMQYKDIRFFFCILIFIKVIFEKNVTEPPYL